MDVKELSNLRLKQTIANFIIPLVAVLASIGLIAFYIYPSLKSLPALQEQLDEKNTLLTKLSTKVQKLNDLLDFKQNVDENLSIIDNALSSEPKVPELLTQIDIIARESGLNVSRLNYSVGDAADVGGSYDVVAVSLGVSGTYNQVITFLSNIEKAARVVSVENIRYASDSESEGLTVTFILSSPYVEVNPSADIDSPITFDITNNSFQDQMNMVRALRFYNISINDYIQVPQESEEVVVPEDTEGTEPIPEPIPEEIPVEEAPIVEVPVTQ